MNSKTLILLLGAAFAFASHAEQSAHWAAVYTTAFGGDSSPSTANRANYSAYFCRKSDVSSFGATAAAMTQYVYAHFESAKETIAESGTALPNGDFVDYDMRYSFTASLASAAEQDDYVAFVLYRNDGAQYTQQAFRVFDVYDAELLADGGDLLFTDEGTAQGEWKSIIVVPEPAGGLLFLVGLAGLALRRRRR